MKQVIFAFGGMSDKRIEKLENKTPLEVALHRNADKLARYGMLGTAGTVPPGCEPLRENVLLPLLGCDAAVCGAGGAAFEAEGMGVRLRETDVAYRCSIVSLEGSGKTEDAVMTDQGCAGLSAEDVSKLLIAAENVFGSRDIDLYAGKGYHALLVLHNAEAGGVQFPPYKVEGRRIGEYLPRGRNSELLIKMTEWSYQKLGSHFINRDRKKPANGLWFWGEGKIAALPASGIKNGVVISDSDLVAGIGRAAGLDAVGVSVGPDGYAGYKKASESAIKAFSDGAGSVMIHINEPEERSLKGDILGKVFSIEQADDKILGPVLRFLESTGEDFSALCLSDLSASCEERAPLGGPVPFALYRSFEHVNEERSFDETDAGKTGVFYDRAGTLLSELLKRRG